MASTTVVSLIDTSKEGTRAVLKYFFTIGELWKLVKLSETEDVHMVIKNGLKLDDTISLQRDESLINSSPTRKRREKFKVELPEVQLDFSEALNIDETHLNNKILSKLEYEEIEINGKNFKIMIELVFY